MPAASTWPFSLFSSSLPDSTKAPSKGIRLLPTEMTFSVSRDRGSFEWAGDNAFTVFCQPSRFFDPTMWRMLYDVFRFNACARQFLQISEGRRMSIGQYLKEEGYSSAFRDNYLIVRFFISCCFFFFSKFDSQPMTAAIWSTPPDKCFDDFPARTLVRLPLFASFRSLKKIVDRIHVQS